MTGAARGAARSTANTNHDIHGATSTLALKSMRLKLRGAQKSREVSERRQVGDTEDMLRANEDTKGAWWRNVGMEEGM